MRLAAIGAVPHFTAPPADVLKWGYPSIIHRIFHDKPSFLGYPDFWNPTSVPLEPSQAFRPCRFSIGKKNDPAAHLVAAETAVCRLASWTRVACLCHLPPSRSGKQTWNTYLKKSSQSNDICVVTVINWLLNPCCTLQ